MKYLMKVADAEVEWQQKATRVKRGEEKSMLTILEERGLIQTVTGFVSSTERSIPEPNSSAGNETTWTSE